MSLIAGSVERCIIEGEIPALMTSETESYQEAGEEEIIPEAEIRQQVFATVHAIPRGCVLSYGEVGARCEPPISGYVCGRIMSQATKDVPWWRVVAKDGALPIRKRNPHLAVEQRQRLEEEGVAFDKEGRATNS